jgi:hypothetical protein
MVCQPTDAPTTGIAALARETEALPYAKPALLVIEECGYLFDDAYVLHPLFEPPAWAKQRAR